VNYDNSLVVTITVTCFSWTPSSADHLFTMWRHLLAAILVTETSYSYVHIVSALRLPGATVGYYLSIFAFFVQCLTVVGFHSQDLTLQGKFEFHKSLKVFRCCLGSPSKSG